MICMFRSTNPLLAFLERGFCGSFGATHSEWKSEMLLQEEKETLCGIGPEKWDKEIFYSCLRFVVIIHRLLRCRRKISVLSLPSISVDWIPANSVAMKECDKFVALLCSLFFSLLFCIPIFHVTDRVLRLENSKKRMKNMVSSDTCCCASPLLLLSVSPWEFIKEMSVRTPKYSK